MTEEMKAMIELVNQSLKEVKSMSKADKMLLDCGIYEIDSYSPSIMTYSKKSYLGSVLEFCEEERTVVCKIKTTLELHLGINEKMKELGWLDE